MGYKAGEVLLEESWQEIAYMYIYDGTLCWSYKEGKYPGSFCLWKELRIHMIKVSSHWRRCRCFKWHGLDPDKANSLPSPTPQNSSPSKTCTYLSSPSQERAQHHEYHCQYYCPGACGEPKAHHAEEEKTGCTGADKSQGGLGPSSNPHLKYYRPRNSFLCSWIGWSQFWRTNQIHLWISSSVAG